ncbi:hypothetical protein GOBAR_DD08358 [Gossypium barbadense]|nr:hypothetical protein GOBAR_DD08358 [Gossypium barbadense]
MCASRADVLMCMISVDDDDAATFSLKLYDGCGMDQCVQRPYGDVEGSTRAREGPGGCSAGGSRAGKRRWELLGINLNKVHMIRFKLN